MIDAGRTKTYIRRQIVREHYVARILRPAVLQNCAVGQLLGNRNRLRRHASCTAKSEPVAGKVLRMTLMVSSFRLAVTRSALPSLLRSATTKLSSPEPESNVNRVGSVPSPFASRKLTAEVPKLMYATSKLPSPLKSPGAISLIGVPLPLSDTYPPGGKSFAG